MQVVGKQAAPVVPEPGSIVIAKVGFAAAVGSATAAAAAQQPVQLSCTLLCSGVTAPFWQLLIWSGWTLCHQATRFAQQLCAPQRLRSTQALLPLACMARDMYKAHLHSKHLRSLLCLLIVLTVLAL